MTKKIIIGAVVILSAFLSVQLVAQAATSKVTYDADSGTLSVTGSCSSRFVLVIIRKSSDGSIWGSSNPTCVDGAYQYDESVPDADRTGSAFSIQVYDQASVGGAVPTAAGGAGASQAVIFSPPPPPAPSAPAAPLVLTIDTSSLNAAPDDVSLLDSALNNIFGIVTATVNAVESSVIAAVQLFAKMFTIVPGGSIKVPAGQNQISGQGTLGAGDSEVFIANTSVTSSSQVIVTPTAVTQVPLVVTGITDGSGFSVGVISPQQVPVTFTWLIINTYAAGAPSQSAPVTGGSAPIVAPQNSPVPEDNFATPADSSSTTTGSPTTDNASTTMVQFASTSTATLDTATDTITDTTTTTVSAATSTITDAVSSTDATGTTPSP